MRMLHLLIGVTVLASTAAPGAARAACGPRAAVHARVDHDSGAEMLGRPAPAWTFDRWARGPALTLRGLRGKVVLVRWWNEGCHYCGATLPTLEALRTRYAREGLVVVGVFHPKPPHPVGDAEILAVADSLGFRGPIAVDERWSTLKRWWLDADSERDWTSVSFLVDRDGKVRWVQGGGEYHPSTDPRHARCDLEFRGLERALAAALSGKTSASLAY